MTGRRERKKAATRQSLADAALGLALERGGYDQVTVAEIADRADVSVTTLFTHFPSKEALFFDQDASVEAALVAAVRDRGDIPLLDALAAFAERNSRPVHQESPRGPSFRRLVEESPALREYAARMWARHEQALAAAIAEDRGEAAPSPSTRALAHVFCGIPGLVQGPDDDAAALREATFAILRSGWPL
ncbi:TetR/AcrR family transcriptional regulator [Pseudonocardia ailaonensis]|uniref:TetR/AcrR family transcriptional regulator n=1 Tax=Pseudonocardia ailaonensis TaxID=367279 RepID=A0ABN2NMC9_9PSEU